MTGDDKAQADNDLQARRWYVVEAHSGGVEAAYLRLAAAGLDVWAPVDEFAERRARQRRDHADRPRRRTFRFGRFLFLRCVLTDSLWHAVANQPHVRRILSRHPVPDTLIAFYRENAPGAQPALAPGFSKGAVVRLLRGPLAGAVGAIAGLDARGIVVVDIEIFGRSTPTVIEVEHVELVAQASSRTRKTFLSPVARARAGAAA